MSSPFFERSNVDNRVGDHHDRIRNLEALVASGSDPSVCPDCVLQPYTVVPGAVPVDPAFASCINVTGCALDFEQVCDNAALVTLLPYTVCGLGGTILAGFRPQIHLFSLGIVVGSPGGMSNIQVVTAFGPDVGSLAPLGANFTETFSTPGGYPGGSDYESGWVDMVGSMAAPPCTDSVYFSVLFDPNNDFFGACRGLGTLSVRWIYDPDSEPYRGILDEIPQGEAFGDTLYFSTDTNEFVEGPRSVPSRAIATFMGG